MDDLHTVRLAILTTLHAARLRPVTVEELARTLGAQGISIAEIRNQLNGLLDHGYIRNVMPGRAMLLKLEAAGRDQVTRDAPLDEYIYGADAYIG